MSQAIGHRTTSGCKAWSPAAYRIPASSGQGGMPIPVKNSQKKIDAYQPNSSVVTEAPLTSTDVSGCACAVRPSGDSPSTHCFLGKYRRAYFATQTTGSG